MGEPTDRKNADLLGMSGAQKQKTLNKNYNFEYDDKNSFVLKEESEGLTEKLEAKSDQEIKMQNNMENIKELQRPVTQQTANLTNLKPAKKSEHSMSESLGFSSDEFEDEEYVMTEQEIIELRESKSKSTE